MCCACVLWCGVLAHCRGPRRCYRHRQAPSPLRNSAPRVGVGKCIAALISRYTRANSTRTRRGRVELSESLADTPRARHLALAQPFSKSRLSPQRVADAAHRAPASPRSPIAQLTGRFVGGGHMLLHSLRTPPRAHAAQFTQSRWSLSLSPSAHAATRCLMFVMNSSEALSFALPTNLVRKSAGFTASGTCTARIDPCFTDWMSEWYRRMA